MLLNLWQQETQKTKKNPSNPKKWKQSNNCKYRYLILTALCTEGMELNNVSLECEPCKLGYYKEDPANDTSLSVGKRFWCLQCPSNLTTRDEGTKDVAGCIGICHVFISNKVL